MHSLEEAHAIARQVLERGIGVNRNDELAPAGREAEKPLSRDGKEGRSLTGLLAFWCPQEAGGHHPVAPQLLGLVEQLVGSLYQGIRRLLAIVFPTPNEAVM